MSNYCSRQDVYDVTGITEDNIESLSGRSEAEVQSLVDKYIAKAESTIKNWIGIPITIRKETHLGDGEKFEFELGPEIDEEVGFLIFDPSDCVEHVYAVYYQGKRKKLPYPKDCDSFTENTSSSYSASNCTLSDEETIVKAGDYSIKAVFSAAGSFLYPSSKNLAKNIDIYDYVVFRFRSSDKSAMFTFKLFDKDDNYNYKTFTVEKANIWYVIMLKIDEFDGDVDWEDELCYAFSIESDKACTVYFDNFAFAEGYAWTAPSGYIIIPYDEDEDESPLPEGYELEVTYSFDPFKQTVPNEIQWACAELAGVYLIDFLRGIRDVDTQFVVESDTIEPSEARNVLLARRTTLLNRAKEHVASYGYEYAGGVV